ncbi:hypothetical protein [Leadbetterella byssophila]|uniref:hypothetical protein n=1 Tax=Leadbetterella byssophila TaxID=316068 RepID=UPI0039A0A1D2
MQRICDMFASSELVPDIYKFTAKPIPPGASEAQVSAIQAENKAAKAKAIANCMIAVEMSQRIGASPLMIMQNMVIIYGRPSWSSKFLIATVNTCGRFEPLKFRITSKGNLGKVSYVDYEWNAATKKKEAKVKEFDGTKVTNFECVAYTSPIGSKDILESAPISIELAVKEGWYTKAGSKWQTMTEQMLKYRAASFWTNTYAPELSMGMKTEEEVRDIIDIDHVDITELAEAERAQKANAETIGFETAPAEDDVKPAEIEAEKAVTPKMEEAKEEQAPEQAGAKVDSKGQIVATF